MRTLSRFFAALAILAASGCTSSPTPHPEYTDATNGTPDGQATADDGARAACTALGGTWASDDDVCVGIEPEFDGSTGALDPATPPTADVVGLTITTSADGAVFHVTIASDDVDCQTYADWWEVVRQDGTLAARRIPAGPHVEDQPWSDASAAIALDDTDRVVVRAHFTTTGYNGQVWVGSLAEGFTPARIATTFAAGLAGAEPLPTTCTP